MLCFFLYFHQLISEILVKHIGVDFESVAIRLQAKGRYICLNCSLCCCIVEYMQTEESKLQFGQM
jgi:hypothetical protein